MRRFLVSLALPLLAAGCHDWRERVDPARAAAEPEQVALAGEPAIEIEARGYAVRLEPRATYRATGYAAETSRKLLDPWDFAMPMDLALIWGPVADPTALRHLKFHLSERYVSYWYDSATPPAVVGKLPTHVANNHLIPASDDVARELRRIRVGDLVTLRGKLVDVEIRDSRGQPVFRSRTSLRRDDVGSGACEQVWVESVEVERPD
ncbi:MAG TPA: hypothetical protein VLD85_02720 [Anaeromyxobacteraceae bacterium]|nr:hypothetical protein [Anaeromyxobacteraceae bacterium]